MTAAPAAPAAAPESREKILQQLEKDAQKQEAEAKRDEAAQKQRGEAAKAQQKDLGELRRASGEIDQSVTAYKDEYPKLKQRHDDLNSYRATKRTRIEAAVGNDKATIQTAIDWVNNQLTAREAKLKEASDALKARREAVKQAEEALAAARQGYDQAKGRAKAVGDGLKSLDDLRKQIDKLEDELDGADTDEERKQAARRAFVALGELDRQSEKMVGPLLVDEQQHTAKLDEAWRRWTEAQTTLHNARAALQEAQGTYDDANQKLQELKDDRIGAVMRRLEESSSAAAPAEAAADGET
jgi:chromosome segregation ATPase